MSLLNIAAGVHEAAPPTDTAARFPGAAWTREFVAGPGGTALPEATTADQLIRLVLAKAGPSVNAGGGCVVSLKIDMASMGKGSWTVRLTALGKALTGMRVIVCLWHEPEDNLPAKVFAAGFNTGRQALKAGWDGLQVAYIAMAYQWRAGSKTTVDAAAWRTVEADLYLIDAYSGNSFPATAILPGHPGFQRWYSEIAARPGRRWGVAERGWLAGPDRVSTIAREADWLAGDPVGRTCQLYLVWGTGGTEANPGWLLDAPAQAAVQALLARITIPAGYRPTTDDTVLIHDATGVLVAADRTAAFNAFLTRT